MQADGVLGLFRFSKSKYIDQFVSGLLFMNPLSHFVKIESNPIRRDEREGHDFWMQPDRVTLSVKIEGAFKAIPGIIGPIAYSHESDLAANVFCMYALRATVAKELVDPRNLAFGDTFAILKDGDEFLRRVRAAVQKAGHVLQSHLVEYVDASTYHGPMGIFRKSSEFSYQSEFRLAILPGTGSPYRLEVGDISDITVTGPIAELNRRMKVD